MVLLAEQGGREGEMGVPIIVKELRPRKVDLERVRERKEEGIELQVPCQMAHFSARALSLVRAEKYNLKWQVKRIFI